MATQQIIETRPQADLHQVPTSMPQCVKSALADSSFGWTWDADDARRALRRNRIDVTNALTDCRASLRPVSQRWLAERLERLWNSTPHALSLKPVDWLSETGRLLADIPADILADAIDTAVKRAERGFMPTVGEIRAIADPAFLERKKQERRLTVIVAIRAEYSPSIIAAEPVDAGRIDTSEVDEGNKMMRRFGLATRYRADGTAFRLAAGEVGL